MSKIFYVIFLQLAAIQKELEAELHSQLKRQAAAHADHVTDLLAAQEKELSHKWSNHLQDSLITEQLAYESKVAGMIGQIKGIERAIKGNSLKCVLVVHCTEFS